MKKSLCLILCCAIYLFGPPVIAMIKETKDDLVREVKNKLLLMQDLIAQALFLIGEIKRLLQSKDLPAIFKIRCDINELVTIHEKTTLLVKEVALAAKKKAIRQSQELKKLYQEVYWGLRIERVRLDLILEAESPFERKTV